MMHQHNERLTTQQHPNNMLGGGVNTFNSGTSVASGAHPNGKLVANMRDSFENLKKGNLAGDGVLAKREFETWVNQLSLEMQAVAVATERELELMRKETFTEMQKIQEETAQKATVEEIHKCEKWLQSVNSRLVSLQGLVDELEDKRNQGGASPVSKVALTNLEKDMKRDIENMNKELDRAKEERQQLKEQMSRDLKDEVRHIEKDLELVRARTNESFLEVQLKLEKLGAERKQDSVVSAAYAAAERRCRNNWSS